MRLIDADELQRNLVKKKAPTGKERYVQGYNDALLMFKSMVHGQTTIVPVIKLEEVKDEQYKKSK